MGDVVEKLTDLARRFGKCSDQETCIEAADEIERLNAENSSLRVHILVLKKSADYHKSQDCIEIQNAICRQRDELSADNARLREALQNILDVYGDDLPGKMARAALAEKGEK